MTFDNGEVFIWKSGCRMKLAKNQRAGNVINVSVVKDLQTLCTSAAPEWAVLQFSVDSVDLCKHCVPQLHLKGLFSSSLWTLCTLLYHCNLCKHCVPQLMKHRVNSFFNHYRPGSMYNATMTEYDMSVVSDGIRVIRITGLAKYGTATPTCQDLTCVHIDEFRPLMFVWTLVHYSFYQGRGRLPNGAMWKHS